MREYRTGVTIDFIYDADGRPFAMKHSGTLYYYILNLQGDVIRLVNASGATVASYEYNPYGKVISATSSMAAINPLRYRGYYYDQETGLYFLMSRYYDPAICRFINADEYASTGQGLLGFNMFAYCRNNPVCRKDATGTDDLTVTDVNDNDNPLDDIGPYYRPGGATASGSSNGSGSNSGKFTFKSEAALKEHFDKHNPEFGNVFSNPQEYVDAANYVIQSGEYVANQNAYIKFYGMDGRANYAFVGMSHNHLYITTFHLKHVRQILF